MKTINERRQHLIIGQLVEGPSSFDELNQFLGMHSELTGADMTISLDILKQDCSDILERYGVEIVYDHAFKGYKINESVPQMEQVSFNKDLYTQVYHNLPEKCHPITKLDLNLLTTLELTECDLDDLSFLKHCYNLEKLNIFSHYAPSGGKTFKPLNSLPFLPALKSLSLHHSGIKNLDMLSSCPKIEVLKVYEPGPINIIPIGKLSNLKRLELGELEITGAEVLNEMATLESLSLDNVNIQHFPFHKVPNVKTFSCWEVRVESMAELIGK